MKLRLIAAVFLVFAHHGIAYSAGTTYSRTATFPPIRTTYAELQVILDKASRLVETANSDNSRTAALAREKAGLEVGGVRFLFSGHSIPISEKKIPKIAFRFSYNRYSYLETSPITVVSLDFDDRGRQLIVAGSSPEHVDAIFDTLRSDLYELSSALGGWEAIFWFRLISTFVFAMVLVRGFDRALKTRTSSAIGVVVFSALSLILLHALPFHEILAGFSVSLGDSTFISKYGPHISFLGLLVSVFGIPLSYYLPRWFGKTEQQSASSERKVHKRAGK